MSSMETTMSQLTRAIRSAAKNRRIAYYPLRQVVEKVAGSDPRTVEKYLRMLGKAGVIKSVAAGVFEVRA